MGDRTVHDLYGYWPTLHDAALLHGRLDLAERTLSLLVHYHDRPVGAERDLHVEMELRFTGLSKAEFEMADGAIDDARLSEEDGLVRLDLIGYGSRGLVKARGMEVFLTRVDAPPDDERTFRLEMG